MRLGLQLGHQPMGLGGVAIEEGVGELELDRESHELLLGPIVDVPLQATTFLVLRGHDPALGGLEFFEVRLEFFREPHVAHQESRLGREARDELLVRR